MRFVVFFTYLLWHSDRLRKSSSRPRNVATTWRRIINWWRHHCRVSSDQWALETNLCGWRLDRWRHRKL